MRALRRVAIATLAAGALVSTLGAGSALAFQPVSFTYDVTNLGPGTHFQAVYSGAPTTALAEARRRERARSRTPGCSPMAWSCFRSQRERR